MKKISALFAMTLASIYVQYWIFLPSRLRGVISPVVEKIYLLLHSASAAVRGFCPNSFVVTARCDGSELKIMFIGKDPRWSYLMQSTSLDIVNIKKGQRSLLRDPAELAEDAGGVDLVAVESGMSFLSTLRKKGFFLIPHWVSFRLPVPETLSDVWKGASKSAKNDIRKVGKNGYTFEVSTDPHSLLMLYENMYVPYITKRFSHQAVVQHYAVLRKMLKIGCVLFIKQREEIIGGHVLFFQDDTLWAKWFGVKDGDEKYIKEGIFSGIEYSTIRYAIENKFTTINFGLCRAFLKDGVFRYKRKWGMVMEKSSLSHDFYGLKVCRLSPGVINFLRRNPFIFSSEDGHEGLLCADSEEIGQAYRHYRTEGLKRLNVLCLSAPPPGLPDSPPPAGLRCVGADFVFRQGKFSHAG